MYNVLPLPLGEVPRKGRRGSEMPSQSAYADSSPRGRAKLRQKISAAVFLTPFRFNVILEKENEKIQKGNQIC